MDQLCVSFMPSTSTLRGPKLLCLRELHYTFLFEQLHINHMSEKARVQTVRPGKAFASKFSVHWRAQRRVKSRGQLLTSFKAIRKAKTCHCTDDLIRQPLPHCPLPAGNGSLKREPSLIEQQRWNSVIMSYAHHQINPH